MFPVLKLCIIKTAINLQIGRTSSGEVHTINLCALPNLFVSYSDDEDLPKIFKSFLQQLNNNNAGITLSISFSSILCKRLEAFTKKANIFIEYNHNGDENSAVRNIDEFIQQLFAEMKNRKVSIKKKTLIPMQPMVIFMDDIFEVLRSHNRKTINAFIALLGKGLLVKMFFVVGCSGLYMNLLQQIVYGDLRNKKNEDTKSLSSLGAELVITVHGLIFLKESGKLIYDKYYPFTVSN